MKDFISKLNDRNLQRKRESGFTSYVIYSIFLLVIYKLFKISEYFLVRTEYEADNLNTTIWLMCFTFNALFNLGYLINILFPNVSSFNNMRLLKKNNIDSYIFLSFILSFPLGLFLIIYTYFTIPIDTFLFTSYSLYIFGLNVWGIFQMYILYQKNRKNELTINKKRNEETVSPIFDLILSFIVIGISIYFIYNIKIEFKAEFIKLLILLYLGYAIIEKILQANTNDQYIRKLEDFEYEIKLKKYDDERISKEFQDNFIGFFINDWIETQNKIFKFRKYTHEEDIYFLQEQFQELEREFDEKNNEKFILREFDLKEKGRHTLIIYNNNCKQQLQLLKDTLQKNCNDLEVIERHSILKLINLLKIELGLPD